MLIIFSHLLVVCASRDFLLLSLSLSFALRSIHTTCHCQELVKDSISNDMCSNINFIKEKPEKRNIKICCQLIDGSSKKKPLYLFVLLDLIEHNIKILLRLYPRTRSSSQLLSFLGMGKKNDEIERRSRFS